MLKLIVALAPAALLAQTQTGSMSIEEYKPKSTLVVPQHPVSRAKYPFIDVHNHQNSQMSQGGTWTNWSKTWTA